MPSAPTNTEQYIFYLYHIAQSRYSLFLLLLNKMWAKVIFWWMFLSLFFVVFLSVDLCCDAQHVAPFTSSSLSTFATIFVVSIVVSFNSFSLPFIFFTLIGTCFHFDSIGGCYIFLIWLALLSSWKYYRTYYLHDAWWLFSESYFHILKQKNQLFVHKKSLTTSVHNLFQIRIKTKKYNNINLSIFIPSSISNQIFKNVYARSDVLNEISMLHSDWVTIIKSWKC